jgi:hypothetical protein
MVENFRREPIRSRDYLNGSKGQPCALQIPHVCLGTTDTTIPGHVRDETFGNAQKADDISVIDMCAACHDLFDGRSGTLSREDWLFYALRGLQRTLRSRVLRGIAVIALDRQKPASEHGSKPRKPPAMRAKINSRNEWPTGQKIQSRNDLRRKERT